MKKLALELGPEGFTVVLTHPGFVKTEMAGPAAELEVDYAAEQLYAI